MDNPLHLGNEASSGARRLSTMPGVQVFANPAFRMRASDDANGGIELKEAPRRVAFADSGLTQEAHAIEIPAEVEVELEAEAAK